MPSSSPRTAAPDYRPSYRRQKSNGRQPDRRSSKSAVIARISVNTIRRRAGRSMTA